LQLARAGGTTPCSEALGTIILNHLYTLRAAASGFSLHIRFAGGEPCSRQRARCEYLLSCISSFSACLRSSSSALSSWFYR
jgi:hypothetical protein